MGAKRVNKGARGEELRDQTGTKMAGNATTHHISVLTKFFNGFHIGIDETIAYTG